MKAGGILSAFLLNTFPKLAKSGVVDDCIFVVKFK